MTILFFLALGFYTFFMGVRLILEGHSRGGVLRFEEKAGIRIPDKKEEEKKPPESEPVKKAEAAVPHLAAPSVVAVSPAKARASQELLLENARLKEELEHGIFMTDGFRVKLEEVTKKYEVLSRKIEEYEKKPMPFQPSIAAEVAVKGAMSVEDLEDLRHELADIRETLEGQKKSAVIIRQGIDELRIIADSFGPD